MWPSKTGLETTHLDAGADNPGLARAALLKMLQVFAKIVDSRGQADGICELDANARVPGGRINKGVAGGICELDATGKVPQDRIANPRVGSGLAIAEDGKLIHASTSTAQSVTLASGHAIRAIDVDRFGHVTAIRSRPLAYVERTSISGPSSSPPDPPVPEVGLSGTWQVVINDIQTSGPPRARRKTRRVIYART